MKELSPSSELRSKWINSHPAINSGTGTRAGTDWSKVIDEAARWGADQELEACCEWLDDDDDRATLRAARRPKQPSLKQQASESLDEVVKCLKMLVPGASADGVHIETIRRALESLPDPQD